MRCWRSKNTRDYPALSSISTYPKLNSRALPQSKLIPTLRGTRQPCHPAQCKSCIFCKISLFPLHPYHTPTSHLLRMMVNVFLRYLSIKTTSLSRFEKTQKAAIAHKSTHLKPLMLENTKELKSNTSSLHIHLEI